MLNKLDLLTTPILDFAGLVIFSDYQKPLPCFRIKLKVCSKITQTSIVNYLFIDI